MLTEVLIAGALVVVTVVIHAIGFGALLRVMMRSQALAMSSTVLSWNRPYQQSQAERKESKDNRRI
jgi:hypothetical protein